MSITISATLTVTSPAFKHNDFIPSKYTCTGANTSPELSVSGIPEETQSLVLIIDDPDAPKGTFDHWVMWNIPPQATIAENSSPGTQGLNSRKENKYMGPCPPSGTHHYHFKFYALDTKLDLAKDTDKAALEKTMQGHILARGELIGLYKK